MGPAGVYEEGGAKRLSESTVTVSHWYVKAFLVWILLSLMTGKLVGEICYKLLEKRLVEFGSHIS